MNRRRIIFSLPPDNASCVFQSGVISRMPSDTVVSSLSPIILNQQIYHLPFLGSSLHLSPSLGTPPFILLLVNVPPPRHWQQYTPVTFFLPPTTWRSLSAHSYRYALGVKSRHGWPLRLFEKCVICRHPTGPRQGRSVRPSDDACRHLVGPRSLPFDMDSISRGDCLPESCFCCSEPLSSCTLVF